jgi:hypothetical protein
VAAASLAARCTLLLRGLPSSLGEDGGKQLLAMLSRRFPGSLLRLHALQDRRAELAIARSLAAASDTIARARLQARLAAVRSRPARGAGIAFATFASPQQARDALRSLCSDRRLPVRGALGSLLNDALWRLLQLGVLCGGSAGEPPIRAEAAPSPDSVVWEHCGVSLLSRLLRSLLANTGLVLVLLAISTPLVVELLDDPSLQKLESQSQGPLQTLLFSLLPMLYTLVTMTVFLPVLVVFSTHREGHLSLAGFRQAVLFKARVACLTAPC